MTAAPAVAVASTPAPRTEALPTAFDTTYTWDYGVDRENLRSLYEKAKRDQWNATDQLAWGTSVDPEAELVPDIQIPVYGTHIWEKLTPDEVNLGLQLNQATVTQP